jgi:hypothetical protein
MLDNIFGLPAHPLIVHATVVMVPMAAVLVLGAAASRRLRNWAGPLPLLTSVVALVLVPLSTSSGESLKKRVDRTALLERHTHLADGLLPWVIVLVVAAMVLCAMWRLGRGAEASSLPKALVAAGIVLAVAGAIGTTVQVVRIGHSGAEAAWSNVAAR